MYVRMYVYQIIILPCILLQVYIVNCQLYQIATVPVTLTQGSPTEVTYAEDGKTTSEDTDEALLHGYALVDLDKVINFRQTLW